MENRGIELELGTQTRRCLYVRTYRCAYQWRAVTFQLGDAVQKIDLHFFKF